MSGYETWPDDCLVRYWFGFWQSSCAVTFLSLSFHIVPNSSHSFTPFNLHTFSINLYILLFYTPSSLCCLYCRLVHGNPLVCLTYPQRSSAPVHIVSMTSRRGCLDGAAGARSLPCPTAQTIKRADCTFAIVLLLSPRPLPLPRQHLQEYHLFTR